MRHRKFSRRAVLGGMTAASVAGPAGAQTAAPRPIEIAAQPLTAFLRGATETKFGRLTFRGGLVLTSRDKAFGGFSGLAIEPNGRTFVAVTDEGSWLTADLVLDGTAPQGITAARMGAISGIDGRPLNRKRDQDCEAVAILDGDLTRGTLLLAFERQHRIERVLVRDRIIQAPISALTMPPDAQRMEANKGLEAMTVLAGGAHKGSVIAFSERLPDAEGHHTGWLWVQGVPERLGLKMLGGFDLTDIAGLPDGSLVVLERRFRWGEGVQMQLRHVPADEIAPGRVAEGRVLFTADATFEIDNMEGLTAHREADGTTVVTIISDNNFNPILQRTIMLRFALDAST